MMIMLLFVNLMVGKVRLLYTLLDELSEKDFKRIKACLHQEPLDGFNNILWSEADVAAGV